MGKVGVLHMGRVATPNSSSATGGAGEAPAGEWKGGGGLPQVP